MQTRITSRKAIAAALVAATFSQALPTFAAPFSAVLPSSRSVEIGTTATAFATVLNPDSSVAEDCSIAPVTNVDADFFYQTTDPATNEVSGTANTPVSIAAGGSQSFVIGLTPNSDFAATSVEFAFSCSTGTAVSSQGINTLLLSGNSTATADVVAVALTPSRDGIAKLPRDGEFGLMSLATTNVGADATITAQPNDLAGIDGFLLICETNQNTGDCLAEPAASTTGLLAGDGTRTYSVFVNSNTRIFLDATNRRTAVDFVDEFGNIRGSTSVAVAGGGPSARTYFDDNIADQILQNACSQCHVDGGDAGASALVFELDDVPGFKDTNFAVVESYLNADPGNAGAIVTAATGGAGHPQIVEENSPAIAAILVFAELFATED